MREHVTAKAARSGSLTRYTVDKPFPGFSAEVVIDEWPRGGMIMVTGELGNYGYCWTNISSPSFREFLLGVSYDYFMGKACACQGYEFDAKATTRALRIEILIERRQGSIEAETARDAWSELEAMSEARTESEFFSDWSDALVDVFGQPYDVTARTRRTAHGALFWNEAWPALCETWTTELKRAKRWSFLRMPPLPSFIARSFGNAAVRR